ncbi:hypothetical protein RF11_02733 [Thelohanellus kitauei]|uniref:Uncharacterized protein n=1 Tax=Thelohanellus kitauei TaxID=669202 RepID=A0A0C2J897_THEKT|nr:hypothetical protein RF11_02733 [Thelohanellus kitauei]
MKRFAPRLFPPQKYASCFSFRHSGVVFTIKELGGFVKIALKTQLLQFLEYLLRKTNIYRLFMTGHETDCSSRAISYLLHHDANDVVPSNHGTSFRTPAEHANCDL